MKILDTKDQLRNKLDDVDSAIKYANDETNRAYKRKQRKENWGMLSFIADEGWLLRFNHERKQNILILLREYRQQLLHRFNEA